METKTNVEDADYENCTTSETQFDAEKQKNNNVKEPRQDREGAKHLRLPETASTCGQDEQFSVMQNNLTHVQDMAGTVNQQENQDSAEQKQAVKDTLDASVGEKEGGKNAQINGSDVGDKARNVAFRRHNSICLTYTPETKELTCKTCTVTTSSENAMEEHIAQHLNMRPFVCNTCQVSFSSSREMMKHVGAQHKEEQVQFFLKGVQKAKGIVKETKENKTFYFSGLVKKKAPNLNEANVDELESEVESKKDEEENCSSVQLQFTSARDISEDFESNEVDESSETTDRDSFSPSILTMPSNIYVNKDKTSNNTVREEELVSHKDSHTDSAESVTNLSSTSPATVVSFPLSSTSSTISSISSFVSTVSCDSAISSSLVTTQSAVSCSVLPPAIYSSSSLSSEIDNSASTVVSSVAIENEMHLANSKSLSEKSLTSQSTCITFESLPSCKGSFDSNETHATSAVTTPTENSSVQDFNKGTSSLTCAVEESGTGPSSGTTTQEKISTGCESEQEALRSRELAAVSSEERSSSAKNTCSSSQDEVNYDTSHFIRTDISHGDALELASNDDIASSQYSNISDETDLDSQASFSSFDHIDPNKKAQMRLNLQKMNLQVSDTIRESLKTKLQNFKTMQAKPLNDAADTCTNKSPDQVIDIDNEPSPNPVQILDLSKPQLSESVEKMTNPVSSTNANSQSTSGTGPSAQNTGALNKNVFERWLVDKFSNIVPSTCSSSSTSSLGQLSNNAVSNLRALAPKETVQITSAAATNLPSGTSISTANLLPNVSVSSTVPVNVIPLNLGLRVQQQSDIEPGEISRPSLQNSGSQSQFIATSHQQATAAFPTVGQYTPVMTSTSSDSSDSQYRPRSTAITTRDHCRSLLAAALSTPNQFRPNQMAAPSQGQCRPNTAVAISQGQYTPNVALLPTQGQFIPTQMASSSFNQYGSSQAATSGMYGNSTNMVPMQGQVPFNNMSGMALRQCVPVQAGMQGQYVPVQTVAQTPTQAQYAPMQAGTQTMCAPRQTVTHAPYTNYANQQGLLPHGQNMAPGQPGLQPGANGPRQGQPNQSMTGNLVAVNQFNNAAPVIDLTVNRHQGMMQGGNLGSQRMASPNLAQNFSYASLPGTRAPLASNQGLPAPVQPPVNRQLSVQNSQNPGSAQPILMTDPLLPIHVPFYQQGNVAQASAVGAGSVTGVNTTVRATGASNIVPVGTTVRATGASNIVPVGTTVRATGASNIVPVGTTVRATGASNFVPVGVGGATNNVPAAVNVLHLVPISLPPTVTSPSQRVAFQVNNFISTFRDHLPPMRHELIFRLFNTFTLTDTGLLKCHACHYDYQGTKVIYNHIHSHFIHDKIISKDLQADIQRAIVDRVYNLLKLPVPSGSSSDDSSETNRSQDVVSSANSRVAIVLSDSDSAIRCVALSSVDEGNTTNSYFLKSSGEYKCLKCSLNTPYENIYSKHLWKHVHVRGKFCDKCAVTDAPIKSPCPTVNAMLIALNTGVYIPPDVGPAPVKQEWLSELKDKVLVIPENDHEELQVEDLPVVEENIETIDLDPEEGNPGPLPRSSNAPANQPTGVSRNDRTTTTTSTSVDISSAASSGTLSSNVPMSRSETMNVAVNTSVTTTAVTRSKNTTTENRVQGSTSNNLVTYGLSDVATSTDTVLTLAVFMPVNSTAPVPGLTSSVSCTTSNPTNKNDRNIGARPPVPILPKETSIGQPRLTHTTVDPFAAEKETYQSLDQFVQSHSELLKEVDRESEPNARSLPNSASVVNPSVGLSVPNGAASMDNTTQGASSTKDHQISSGLTSNSVSQHSVNDQPQSLPVPESSTSNNASGSLLYARNVARDVEMGESLEKDSRSHTKILPPGSFKESDFFRCGMKSCRFSCQTSKEYKAHMEKYHWECSHYYCPYCSSKECGYHSLAIHMKHHLKDQGFLFTCSFDPTKCKYTTNSLQDLKVHLTEFHEKIPKYTCMRCFKVFESVENLCSHLEDNVIKFTSCPHCFFASKLRREVNSHIVSNHPKKSRHIVVCTQLLCKVRMTNYLANKRANVRVITPMDGLPALVDAALEQDAENPRSVAPAVAKGDTTIVTEEQRVPVPSPVTYEPVLSKQGKENDIFTLVSSGMPSVSASVEKMDTSVEKMDTSVEKMDTSVEKMDTSSTVNKSATKTTDIVYYKCEKCTFAHTEQAAVVRHKKAHDRVLPPKDRPFVCDICPTGTETLNSFTSHMEKHIGNHNLVLYKCCGCTYKSNMVSEINSHIAQQHSGTDIRQEREVIQLSLSALPCIVCNTCAFSSEQGLNEHKRLQHGHMGISNVNQSCAIKDNHRKEPDHSESHDQLSKEQEAGSSPVVTSTRHSQQQDDKRKSSPLKCSMCDLTSSDSVTYSNHVTKHQRNRGDGDKCDFLNNTSSGSPTVTDNGSPINSNSATCTTSDRPKPKVLECAKSLFECNLCDTKCDTVQELQAHITSIHNDSYTPTVITCSFCPLKSTNRMTIRRHNMETHAEEMKRKFMNMQCKKLDEPTSPDTPTGSKRESSSNTSPTDNSGEIPAPKKPKLTPQQGNSTGILGHDSKEKSQKPFYIPIQNVFAEPVECSECSFSTQNRSLLIIHVKNCHKNLYPVFLESPDDPRQPQPKKNSPVSAGSLPKNSKPNVVTLYTLDGYIDAKRKNLTLAKGGEKRSSMSPKLPQTSQIKMENSVSPLFTLGGIHLHGRLRPCFQHNEDTELSMCCICLQSGFDDLSLLHRHILSHYKIGFFSCKICSREELDIKDMIKHLEKQHKSSDITQITVLTEEEIDHRLTKGMHTLKMAESGRVTHSIDMKEFNNVQTIHDSFNSEPDYSMATSCSSDHDTQAESPGSSSKGIPCSAVTKENIHRGKVKVNGSDLDVLPSWLKPKIRVKRLTRRQIWEHCHQEEVRPRVIRKGDIYSCSICRYKATEKETVKRHLKFCEKSHRKQKGGAQAASSRHGSEDRALTLKTNNNNNNISCVLLSDGRFGCSECSYTASERYKISGHIGIKHSQVSSIPCPHCQTQMYSSRDLAKHVKRKHPCMSALTSKAWQSPNEHSDFEVSKRTMAKFDLSYKHFFEDTSEEETDQYSENEQIFTHKRNNIHVSPPSSGPALDHKHESEVHVHIKDTNHLQKVKGTNPQKVKDIDRSPVHVHVCERKDTNNQYVNHEVNDFINHQHKVKDFDRFNAFKVKVNDRKMKIKGTDHQTLNSSKVKYAEHLQIQNNRSSGQTKALGERNVFEDLTKHFSSNGKEEKPPPRVVSSMHTLNDHQIAEQPDSIDSITESEPMQQTKKEKCSSNTNATKTKVKEPGRELLTTEVASDSGLKYRCCVSNCKTFTKNETDMKSHLYSHLGYKKYRCKICNHRSFSPLKDHHWHFHRGQAMRVMEVERLSVERKIHEMWTRIMNQYRKERATISSKHSLSKENINQWTGDGRKQKKKVSDLETESDIYITAVEEPTTKLPQQEINNNEVHASDATKNSLNWTDEKTFLDHSMEESSESSQKSFTETHIKKKKWKRLIHMSSSDEDSDNNQDGLPRKRPRKDSVGSEVSKGSCQYTGYGKKPSQKDDMEVKDFLCHCCEYRGQSMYDLQRHLLVHSYQGSRTSGHVQSSINRDSALLLGSTVMYVCSYCHANNSGVDHIFDHVASAHPEKPIDYTESKLINGVYRQILVPLQCKISIPDLAKMPKKHLKHRLHSHHTRLSLESKLFLRSLREKRKGGNN